MHFTCVLSFLFEGVDIIKWGVLDIVYKEAFHFFSLFSVRPRLGACFSYKAHHNPSIFNSFSGGRRWNYPSHFIKLFDSIVINRS